MVYMVTFTINIPQMLAYIPYMDPMGNDYNGHYESPKRSKKIPFPQQKIVFLGVTSRISLPFIWRSTCSHLWVQNLRLWRCRSMCFSTDPSGNYHGNYRKPTKLNVNVSD